MTDGLKARHRAAIIAALAANDRVERAVLFGSRAVGTNTITSDVDIALFGQHLTLTDQASLAVACEELPMAQSVDLVLHSAIDNPALVEHIRSHGVEWYRRGGGTVVQGDMGPQWCECTLGDVITLKRGYDLPKKMREVGNIPVVSSSGVSDYHNEAMVKGPGVVTGRYGTIGNVYYIEQDFFPLNTSLYVQDFKSNDPRFISYYLKTINYLSCSDKAAVPGVNRNHLHSLKVKIPPLSEQRSIAHILGTLDDKIELSRRMNETLEAMARALFKDWFVDFGPVRAKAEGREAYLPEEVWGLFPDSFEDSELGEIPRGWGVEEVGNVVDCVGGSTPSTQEPDYWDGGDNFWVTPKDLSSLAEPFLLDTAKKITRAGVERISSGILPVGTVLISSRAPVGYVAVAKVRVSINQGFIALKSTDLLPTEYLLNWSLFNVQQFKDRASGTTFAEISKKEFRPIPILIPSQEPLKAFASHSVSLYEKIISNIKETTILTSMRDTFLPKLLSGEIRVGGVEKVAEMTI